jgi:hypothetical protein
MSFSELPFGATGEKLTPTNLSKSPYVDNSTTKSVSWLDIKKENLSKWQAGKLVYPTVIVILHIWALIFLAMITKGKDNGPNVESQSKTTEWATGTQVAGWGNLGVLVIWWIIQLHF